MYSNTNYYSKGMMPMRTGTVSAFWNKWTKLIQVNDAKRNFSLKTRDCHDQQAPFYENQETITEITHEDHDISQIQDGFWTFKIKFTGRLTGIDKSFNDPNHLVKVFVGFKSSNQVFDRGQFLLDGHSIGYQQNEMTREGFAYANLKSYNEKKTRKYIHSLYENVSNLSTSVCGEYLDVDEFKDGQPHEFEMKLIVPFTDLLALQAFAEFPNQEVGQLAFKGYFTSKGMVYTFISPAVVNNYKSVVEGKPVDVDVIDANTNANFDHKFIQCGVHSNGICNCNYEQTTKNNITFTKLNTSSGQVSFDITNMQIMELKSNMPGYKISEAAKSAIHSVFQRGVYIPSQQLDFHTFPLQPSSIGINTTNNIPISNLTCLSIMFPRHDQDYTVFENPCYNNLQLSINGRNFPDETIDTTDARFLQYQLEASELDGANQCTKEYEDSIIMAKNDTDGTRYKNCLSDCTGFMWNVQLERGSAGYCFDGFDSDGLNVPVQIRGQPIVMGKNDTYYNVNPEGTLHPPQIQMWLCRDTYFIVKTGVMKYVSVGSPRGSQSDERV